MAHSQKNINAILDDIASHTELLHAAYEDMSKEAVQDTKAVLSILERLNAQYKAKAKKEGKPASNPEIQTALNADIEREIAPYADAYLTRLDPITFSTVQDRVGNLTLSLSFAVAHKKPRDINMVTAVSEILSDTNPYFTDAQTSIRALQEDMKKKPELIKKGEEAMVKRIQDSAAVVESELQELGRLAKKLSPYRHINVEETASPTQTPTRS